MQQFKLAALALVLGLSTAWAQETDHSTHRVSDHVAPPMSGDASTGAMDHGAAPAASGESDDGAAEPRDPHAYSGGHNLGPYELRLADTHRFGLLLMDRFEAVRADGETSAAYDLQAWYGGTYNRAVLKAEGEADDGELHEARTELLWSHAIAAYWDAQFGMRHDSREGPNRTWLAFGVQGLAPYWFEVEATGYLGEDGRSALRLEAEYELLLTQRLILQPAVEAELYGKRDPERGLGSGLAEVSAGLRLRYEIRREFAPYVGVEWARLYSGTEDLARAGGDDVRESRALAGLRFWF